jgi:hypothetical protein
LPSVGALRAKLGMDMADPEKCRPISVRIRLGDKNHNNMVTSIYSVFKYH